MFPSLGAIYSTLYNDTGFFFIVEIQHIRKWNKLRRDAGAGQRLQRAGLLCGMDDSRGCFCMKGLLSLCPSMSPSISFFLVCVWRTNGALLASSQEVNLNCGAMLPNDERLWHPGMHWAWTKSSEREKMLAFQLNTFFLQHFFSGAFWCWFFHHQGRHFFFFFHEHSLGATAPRGRTLDGWKKWGGGGGQRMGSQKSVYVWLKCVMCSLKNIFKRWWGMGATLDE